MTNAQIGDSTNAEFLRSLGIGNYDICFVAIGEASKIPLKQRHFLKNGSKTGNL